MTEERTRVIAEQWFGNCSRGDFDTALKLVDPDVYWENIPRLPFARLGDLAPWFGTYRGLPAVLDSFKVWGGLSRMLSYTVEQLFVNGEEVLAIVHEHAQCLANQVEYDLFVPTRLWIRNDRIVRWQVYWDPSPLIAAYQTGMAERLLQAVRTDDAAAAERCFATGIGPDVRDSQTGLTPLMLAAGLGREEMARLLLRHGADVHCIDARAGASALHKACQSGCLPIIEMLVAAGAFIDLQAAGTGHTPLIEAMWFKNVEAARFLLEKGARIGLKTAYGFTVLDHLAFMLKVNVKGGEKILQIKELLDGRMARDRKMAEEQMLMAATVAGDTERVKALLAKGVAVDERSPVVGGFNDAHTPLLVASRDGHTEIVRLLIAAGADVNAVEPTFGAVPLHKATYNGHVEIVRLLAACPGVHLDYRGPSNGYTPLHDALWHGYGECARILVEAGARLDLAGHDGLTPLDLSARILGVEDPVTQLIRNRTTPKTELA